MISVQYFDAIHLTFYGTQSIKTTFFDFLTSQLNLLNNLLNNYYFISFNWIYAIIVDQWTNFSPLLINPEFITSAKQICKEETESFE